MLETAAKALAIARADASPDVLRALGLLLLAAAGQVDGPAGRALEIAAGAALDASWGRAQASAAIQAATTALDQAGAA